MILTKTIVTLGPASESEELIRAMIKTGISIFRFNTKHGDLKWHGERVERVRKIAKELGTPVAILVDLRGPELRVGTFAGGKIKLAKGEEINFVHKPSDCKGKCILIEELPLIKGLKPGNRIYLDDGYLETQVTKVSKDGCCATAQVIEGGFLKNNKGINFPAVDVDLPSLIKKDLEFISMPAKKDIDYFGYSFVRNRQDVLELKKAIKKQGLQAKIVAKIETQQALDNFEEILQEADAIMIARGDLGIEIPLEQVPYYQKMIVKKCREAAKPVIVATQMLESMIEKPRPTRAEAADVANAVYDATDSTMLSGETAGGCFPLQAVRTMRNILGFIEQKTEPRRINFEPQNLSELITFSAFKLINNKHQGDFVDKLDIKAFVVFTDTGATARYLSRLRPAVPIYAVTQTKEVQDQLCLSYGIQPWVFKFPQGEIRSTKLALNFLKEKKVLVKKDKVIVIYGKHWGVPGETNTIRVEEIK
jgi:pyruvate kinase